MPLTQTRWPGGNNITSDKVPSEVAYSLGGSAVARDQQHLRLGKERGRGSRPTEVPPDKGRSSSPDDLFDFEMLGTALDASQGSQDKSPAHAEQMRWGFQVRPDEPRLRCLKLLLDPRQPIPSYVSLDDIRQQLRASGKSVATVVAEYLSALFVHTKEILVRRYGAQFVATTKIHVVLTVPAVWSDAASDATLKAAEAAGMGKDITLISEPEAAAVYTLQAIQPNHLTVGHNFIVIDAGGGTVDLITYGIKQLTPLRLEEIVPGSGGCCGAAFLNVRFQDFVRGKLGDTVFNKLREKKPRSWLTALKYFEDYVKRNFDPEEEMIFNIPFPGVPDNAAGGIEQGFMCMETSEVWSLFKPIIKDIVKLVDDQISAVQAKGQSVNGLILVGGFGQSECLLKCLRARFSKPKHMLEVMQPVNAWTAVVRGAVLRGLEGAELVLNRKSRRHYGVTCDPKFDPLVHPASCRYWDQYTEIHRARDQMRWYIKKGDTVSSTEPVTFPFGSSHAARRNGTTMTHELIVCDEDVAPTAYDASTRVVCKMLVNLESVPRHLWSQRRTSTGLQYNRLHFDLGMQIESGALRFDFRVDGVVYEKVTATFD